MQYQPLAELDVHDVGDYRHGAGGDASGMRLTVRPLIMKERRTSRAVSRHRHPHRGRRPVANDKPDVLTRDCVKASKRSKALMAETSEQFR
jgi:hypothetical protein